MLKAEDGNIIYLSDYIWVKKVDLKRNTDLYHHALFAFGYQGFMLKERVRYENEKAVQEVAQIFQAEKDKEETGQTPEDSSDPPPAGGPNRAA